MMGSFLTAMASKAASVMAMRIIHHALAGKATTLAPSPLSQSA
jgi:hypothetical protein